MFGGVRVQDNSEGDIPSTNAMLKPKDVFVDRETFDMFLFFSNRDDEDSYRQSSKNIFYYPTFMPFFIIFVIMVTIQSQETLEQDFSGSFLSVVQLILTTLNYLLLFSFIVAQTILYFKDFIPLSFQAFRKFVLKRFLYGHVEDAIVLLNAIIQGLGLLFVTLTNKCGACSMGYAVATCTAENEEHFPLHHLFFAFVLQMVLPNFLKSAQRHVAMFGMGILTVCTVIAYIGGGYEIDVYVVLATLFFLVSVYEFERFKMMSFLLSKAALDAELSKLERSKIEARAKIEKKMNMALLQQILPQKVADRILQGKAVEPESFDEVTIFFSDVVGFTNICAAVKPIQVVKMLNDLYTVMDYCTSLFPLYKVETIGDAYMVVGGLPLRDKHHAEQVADFALLVSRAVQSVKSPADGTPIRIRIGLHSGPVMAGVVGNLMPRYCLFGDTVNTASRMESNGEAGKIHCSGKTAEILIATNKFNIEKRGDIPIKGKGIMTTYWLENALESNTNSNSAAMDSTTSWCVELLHVSADEIDGDHNRIMLLKRSFSSDHLSVIDEEHGGGETTPTDADRRLGTPPLLQGVDLKKAFNRPEPLVIGDNAGSAKHTRSTSGPHSLSEAPTRGSIIPARSGQGQGLMLLDDSGAGAGADGVAPEEPLTPLPGAQRRPSFLMRLRVGGGGGGGGRGGGGASPGDFGGSPPSRTPHSARSTLAVIKHNIQRGIVREIPDDLQAKGARILVVEDSKAQRKMLVKRLEKADSTWDVKQASSGEDALAKLKAAKLRFDVVFVDENLSSEDGLFGHELVDIMRDSYNMTACVIIACTSNPAKATENLLAAGVDYVWPKPPPEAHVIKPKIDSLLIERLRMQIRLVHDEHDANTAAAAATEEGEGGGGNKSRRFSEEHSSRRTEGTDIARSTSTVMPYNQDGSAGSRVGAGAGAGVSETGVNSSRRLSRGSLGGAGARLAGCSGAVASPDTPVPTSSSRRSFGSDGGFFFGGSGGRGSESSGKNYKAASCGAGAGAGAGGESALGTADVESISNRSNGDTSSSRVTQILGSLFSASSKGAESSGAVSGSDSDKLERGGEDRGGGGGGCVDSGRVSARERQRSCGPRAKNSTSSRSSSGQKYEAKVEAGEEELSSPM